MSRWMLAAVLALAACKKGKDPATCRADAHALAQLLGSIDRDFPPFGTDDVHLVMRADLPKVELFRAPVLELRADGRVVLDGSPIDGRGQLVDRLQPRREAMLREFQERPELHPPDPALLNLLVDEGAPWETVVWVADAALAAGFDHPAVAFARPPQPVTRPPRSSIDDELDAAAAAPLNDRAVQFADTTRKVVGSCPALIEVFGQIGATDGDKSQPLIDGLEPALVACNCRLDMAAIGSVMFRLFYVEHPATAVAIVLAADGRPVVQPAATPWRDANQLLTAGAPLHLGVAP